MRFFLITAFAICTLPLEVAAQDSREENAASKPATASEKPLAKVVHSQVVTVRADNRSMADIAVFNGSLFLSFLECCDDSSRSCIRIMSSNKGDSWVTAARIRQEERGRCLVRRHEDRSRYYDFHSFPRLDVVPGKRMTVRLRDAAINPDKYNLHRKVGWTSVNGTEWKYEGALKEILNRESRITWRGKEGFAFDFDAGVGDGGAEKLWIRRTTDGSVSKSHYIYELPKYAPRRGSLFFVADQLYFLMPRYGKGRKSDTPNSYVNGELGTSSPPYQKWTWKEIDGVICSPQVVHVPEKGVFAVVEFRDAKKRRTSLCKLDVETGKFKELLKFGDLRLEQTGIWRYGLSATQYSPLGLTVHDGHIWMSYCTGRSVKIRKIAIQ